MRALYASTSDLCPLLKQERGLYALIKDLCPLLLVKIKLSSSVAMVSLTMNYNGLVYYFFNFAMTLFLKRNKHSYFKKFRIFWSCNMCHDTCFVGVSLFSRSKGYMDP